MKKKVSSKWDDFTKDELIQQLQNLVHGSEEEEEEEEEESEEEKLLFSFIQLRDLFRSYVEEQEEEKYTYVEFGAWLMRRLQQKNDAT